MNNNLSITLLQTDLYWENPSANLAMFEELLWNLKDQTDLIVLPEMFTTGFTMNTTLAEPMNLTTMKWLKQQAGNTKAAIVGSYIVQEGERYYNRLIFMQPNGQFYCYDKKHLFRMANEHQFYSEGQKRLIVHWRNWRICPLVCYDIRFPIWSYNIENEQIAYDCLLYIANFPEVRATAWNALLKARAIENWSYCIGVNRVGIDGKGVAYCGDSAVISPKGTTLFSAENEVVVITVELDFLELKTYREKFPAYLDADRFEIK